MKARLKFGNRDISNSITVLFLTCVPCVALLPSPRYPLSPPSLSISVHLPQALTHGSCFLPVDLPGVPRPTARLHSVRLGSSACHTLPQFLPLPLNNLGPWRTDQCVNRAFWVHTQPRLQRRTQVPGHRTGLAVAAVPPPLDLLLQQSKCPYNGSQSRPLLLEAKGTRRGT